MTTSNDRQRITRHPQMRKCLNSDEKFHPSGSNTRRIPNSTAPLTTRPIVDLRNVGINQDRVLFLVFWTDASQHDINLKNKIISSRNLKKDRKQFNHLHLTSRRLPNKLPLKRHYTMIKIIRNRNPKNFTSTRRTP